jgi:hypothetical protein
VGMHAQRRDTVLFIGGDSTCYLKLPLERIAGHHTISYNFSGSLI